MWALCSGIGERTNCECLPYFLPYNSGYRTFRLFPLHACRAGKTSDFFRLNTFISGPFSDS